MSKILGRQVSFGIAKEQTRGTPEAAPTFWIPFNDLSLDEKQERAEEDQAYGVIEESLGQAIVKEWMEANLKMPVYDKTIGLILFSLLGTINSANHTGETTVKDHTITVAQSAQHQALSLFLDDPAGSDYKYGLGVVTSFEINYELNKFIEVTVGFKSKKGASATLTPSQSLETKFTSKHVVFKLAADAASLTAATAMVIKKLNLKINQNIEDDDGLGSTSSADFLNKQMSIQGTIEAVYQNETDFKTVALGVTKKALRIDLINSDVTIGNAAHPEVRIDLNKVLFEPIATNRGLNNIITQTAAFKAFYDATDAKMITAVVTNATASY